jgi:hypothetical protein
MGTIITLVHWDLTLPHWDVTPSQWDFSLPLWDLLINHVLEASKFDLILY